jgi:hypothetical protein
LRDRRSKPYEAVTREDGVEEEVVAIQRPEPLKV